MRNFYLMGLGFIVILITASTMAAAQTIKDPTTVKVPAEYQNKHIPAGYWADPKIIKEGKEIYEGMVNAMVNCSACHGMDGKPMLPGARDFRDASYMGKMTDSYWFWRISEGVSDTQMAGFKKMLKEEQIWKLISYENTFAKSHK
jgi:mono/diheme cytochrome c family protein